MGATQSGLTGLGFPGEVASRGVRLITLTTTAATQNSTGGLLRGRGDQLVSATPGSNNGAVTLPSLAELMDTVLVFNASTSLDLLVFPPTGQTLQNGAANLSVTVPANAQAGFVRVSNSNWKVGVGSAVVPA